MHVRPSCHRRRRRRRSYMSSPHRLHSLHGQRAGSGVGGGDVGRTAFERARPGSNLSRPFPNRRWSDGRGRLDGRGRDGRTDGWRANRRLSIRPSASVISRSFSYSSHSGRLSPQRHCAKVTSRAKGAIKERHRERGGRASERPTGRVRKRWPP